MHLKHHQLSRLKRVLVLSKILTKDSQILVQRL